MTKRKKLLLLFGNMLYISAFTFGGGFVIATLIKKKFVDELHWIEEAEMLDMIALGQSSPGPIAVNIAILTGTKIAGAAGMAAAVAGTIIPPVVIISVISFFYNAFASNTYVALFLKGMQTGVAAVIADVVFSLGGKVIKEKSKLHITVMAAAFTAVFFFRVNILIVIAAAFVTGIAEALIRKKAGAAA